MKVLRRKETWIHTYFVTDGFAVSAAQKRQIKSEIESFLFGQGIVFGIHFEEARGDEGLKIVLECIPLPDTMERIQVYLEKSIKEIPAYKPVIRKIRVERPL